MRFARSIGIVTAAAAAAGIALGLKRSPRMTTWGATEEEVAASMAGDDLIGRAKYRSTHAITIDALPEDVWPWLAQLGQGRGGLYSYDWLENLLGLDIHSVQGIDARLQALSLGDVVRLVPEGTEPPLRFAVVRLDAPSLLVLGPDKTRAEAFAARLPYPCWTFQLTPVAASSCRLVVRFQADFNPTPFGWLAYNYALQPIHFAMERKMLMGIKERAERSPDPVGQLSVLSA
jgi:hypothetical protein